MAYIISDLYEKVIMVVIDQVEVKERSKNLVNRKKSATHIRLEYKNPSIKIDFRKIVR